MIYYLLIPKILFHYCGFCVNENKQVLGEAEPEVRAGGGGRDVQLRGGAVQSDVDARRHDDRDV